jgi:RNA polymerase sigma factor (TIGR02999 family)
MQNSRRSFAPTGASWTRTLLIDANMCGSSSVRSLVTEDRGHARTCQGLNPTWLPRPTLRKPVVPSLSPRMSDAPPPPDPPAGDIAFLVQRTEHGNARAADQILALVYGELRKLAAAKMARESEGQTLQPTALVHEAWLRLGGAAQPDWKNRAHFFSAAAEAMRRILIENARRKHRIRHGGRLDKVSASATGFDLAAPELDDAELLRLNEALDRLTEHDARKAALVKHRYFVGLTLEETAGVMGISERTAKRDWVYARAWLFGEMKKLR